jgi:hypothetical protein
MINGFGPEFKRTIVLAAAHLLGGVGFPNDATSIRLAVETAMRIAMEVDQYRATIIEAGVIEFKRGDSA